MEPVHPRFRLYPFHGDYAAQPNVFCPHLTAISKPGYASRTLNIDGFGFRRQFDGRGRPIDLGRAAAVYERCDVLLGNSTSFGVSVSGDARTLNHLIQEPDTPCINLSVRGATMQQELAAYLVHRRFLPKPRRVVLVTGICDVSLAVQPVDLWSDAVGGVHGSATMLEQYQTAIAQDQDLAKEVKRSFLAWAEQQFFRRQWLQDWFVRRYLAQRAETTAPAPQSGVSTASMDALMPGVFARMAGAVHHWGVIARGEGIEVDVVLQPVLGWTSKRMHADERECVEADALRYPGISLYTTAHVHAAVSSRMDQACRLAGVRFLDGNRWFEAERLQGRRLFSDICHLTDDGTEAFAEALRAASRPRSAAHAIGAAG